MSFRCQICKKGQAPRQKPNRIVTKVRRNRDIRGSGDLLPGFQIEEEKNVCDDCEGNVEDMAVKLRESLSPLLGNSYTANRAMLATNAVFAALEKIQVV